MNDVIKECLSSSRNENILENPIRRLSVRNLDDIYRYYKSEPLTPFSQMHQRKYYNECGDNACFKFFLYIFFLMALLKKQTERK